MPPRPAFPPFPRGTATKLSSLGQARRGWAAWIAKLLINLESIRKAQVILTMAIVMIMLVRTDTQTAAAAAATATTTITTTTIITTATTTVSICDDHNPQDLSQSPDTVLTHPTNRANSPQDHHNDMSQSKKINT